MGCYFYELGHKMTECFFEVAIGPLAATQFEQSTECVTLAALSR